MTFPVHLLRKEDTVLCLFCAAFGGRQDAAFLRDAGLKRVRCVDRDVVKIQEMAPLYPDFSFATDDVFEMLWGVKEPVDEFRRWDVITADPWTGNMDERLRGFLPALLAMTKRVLILGCGVGEVEKTAKALSDLGHLVQRIKRSDTAFWLVVVKP